MSYPPEWFDKEIEEFEIVLPSGSYQKAYQKWKSETLKDD
jgi:hypothetical protein